MKDELLWDIGEALDSIDPNARDLLRAGLLCERSTAEITDAVLDAIPDSSFESSWVKAYLNEWEKNGTRWWEEHGEWVEETYLPLLEQEDDEVEEAEDEKEQQAVQSPPYFPPTGPGLLADGRGSPMYG